MVTLWDEENHPMAGHLASSEGEKNYQTSHRLREIV